MSDTTVPFHIPTSIGTEIPYVQDAVARRHLSSGGYYTEQVEQLLETALGARRIILTTSCTSALELAALLLGIGPGDEVVLPSFTFVSTANAFVLRGARPVFAEIRPDTLNLDEARLEQYLSPRTRAVFAVHYAGVGCEMGEIVPRLQERGIPLIEDNAQGLFGEYRGQALATFGAFGALSFHDTKNFTSGEGGALIVNAVDMLERAEVLRDKGTNRGRFLRGEVDKYTWVDAGSSFGLSDMQAAFLLAQLEARESVTAARAAAWHRYDDALREWAAGIGAQLPAVPEGCLQPYHLYYLLMPSEPDRDALISGLRERGIRTAFHYVPLHLSQMGRTFGYTEGDLPVTESAAARLVRLPLFTSITPEQQDRVIEAIYDVFPV